MDDMKYDLKQASGSKLREMYARTESAPTWHFMTHIHGLLLPRRHGRNAADGASF